MKLIVYPHGFSTIEKDCYLYTVKFYIGTELHDKVRCDTRQAAQEYFKAFAALAKNA